MIKLLSIFVYFIIASNGQQNSGCDIGWYRYEFNKCVYILDIDSTYDETDNYCDKNFGARVLNIIGEDERKYWSFMLIRYFNMSYNVWLQKPKSSGQDHECLALRSKSSSDKNKVGSIIKQNCDDLGSTVCEIDLNKKPKTNIKVAPRNPNEKYVPNKQIKLSNGTFSEFYTGVYYIIKSKFKNSSFSNRILANGKCNLDNQESKEVTMYLDKDIDEKDDYYVFSSEEKDDQIQIRRFNSDKIIVYEPNNYLSNFECGKDSLTASGKSICKLLLNDYKAEDFWKINQFKNTSYYIIKSSYKNYTLGAKIFDDGKNGTVGFGLYDSVDERSDVDDKFLFQIVPLNYSLNVEIYTIQFEKSLPEIVAANKKQISIVDTVVINNNSPSTMTHAVESTRELTETFTTSYATSQQFMDSFTNSQEIGNINTNTDTQSRSFAESTANAISSSLSKTITGSNSNTYENHQSDSKTTTVTNEKSGGIPFIFQVKTTTTVSNTHESGSSHSNTRINSNENGKSDTIDDKQSHENNHGDENTHTDINENRNSTIKSKENQKNVEVDKSKSGSTKKTYSILKTVNLPAYSAVKISSYANWINDVEIPFNMTLKFTVKSFRRPIDGSGSNSWQTMDAIFVKHVMKNHLFNGNIKKEIFDTVFGEIAGYLKASVGLESVFSAKTIKLYNGV